MAELVGLCQQAWNETIFDGNQLVSCPSDMYQLLPETEAASQPDLLDYTSQVATCTSDFQEIVSGASHVLTCSENDFQYISRIELLGTSSTGNQSGFMSQIQYDQLWLLIFICGLLMAFGLGAIKGGQR
jgi:hypothetical protein